MKITLAMVEVVERMLAEGLVSQRKIAKLVGISRGTVNSIALGRRPRISTPADEFERQRGPLVRCPGCGGKVFMPCLLCHVRQLKARDEGLQVCAHRGAARRPAHWHGGDARTCHRAATRSNRSDTLVASQSQFVVASRSVVAPPPEVSSFTPAAASPTLPHVANLPDVAASP
jgi:DNA-directed RNA polymerase subunit RPC12/RpoP